MAHRQRLLLVAKPGPLADGLSSLLRVIPGIEVVGPMDDLWSALLRIAEMGPTAVLVDSGPFARQTSVMVRRLKETAPCCRCIVLADDVRQQRAAERGGADAVLLKGCRPADLLATVVVSILGFPGPPNANDYQPPGWGAE